MKSKKHSAILPLAVLALFGFAGPLEAQPAQPMPALKPELLAPAPEVGPYGWWYSKSSVPYRGGGMAGRQVAAYGAAQAEAKAAADQKDAAKPGQPGAAAGGHPASIPMTGGQGHPGASAMGGHPPNIPRGDGQAQGHPGASAMAAAVAAGHPASIPIDGGQSHPGAAASAPPESPKPGQQTPPTTGMGGGSMPSTHSFAMNRSPIQSFYLGVVGAEMPEEAPEVYYRFTARTMERHGGVALGSSYHQAKVVRDGQTWRVDVLGPSFGTVEMFSRFKLGDRVAYSQYNYLHFAPPEAGKDLEPPAKVEMPADWPIFDFPTSSYNDMAFRATTTGNKVEFKLAQLGARDVPQAALVLEENGEAPVPLDYSGRTHKFAYTPEDDPSLLEEGSRGSKRALAVVQLPGSDEIMTFSLGVNRSRWSTKKLDAGLASLAGVGLITSTIVIRRRRRFKYNDRD